MKFLWYATVGSAIFFMGVLAWEHVHNLVFNADFDVCGVVSGLGCREALNHPKSKFAMLPVSFWAIAVYVLLILNGPSTWHNVKKKGLGSIVVLALVGTSIYYLFLMEKDFSELCPVCLATHVCHFILFVLLCVSLVKSPSKYGMDSTKSNIGLVFPVLVLLCGYTVTLWADTVKNEHSVKQIIQNNFTQTDQGESVDRLYLEQPFQLISGSSDSRYRLTIVGSLACRHCREAIETVLSLPEEMKRQVSVAFVPYPVSPACNANVGGDAAAKGERCVLAEQTIKAQKEGRFRQWFKLVHNAPGRVLRNLKKDIVRPTQWNEDMLMQISLANEAQVEAIPFFIWQGKKMPKSFNRLTIEEMLRFLLNYEQNSEVKSPVKFDECDEC